MKRLLLLSLVLLTGCIKVDDLGGYWEKAVADPNLVGNWRTTNKEETINLSVIRREDHLIYLEDGAEQKTELKSIQAKGHFFILAKEEDGTGELFLYQVEGGMVNVYSMKSDVFKRIVQNKSINGYSENAIDIPHIKKLDEPTLELLGKLADDPQNWELNGKYARVTE